MTPNEKAKELVDKYIFYVESYSSDQQEDYAKQCALICVEREIELIKKIIDESINIHQSLSTHKKLCVDILNPILKEYRELIKEIVKI